ncbi:MAG: DNA-3-methyladenine glycosylase I [Pseudomonadota bacterium]
MARCDWCGDDPLYVDYHDAEWGVPVTSDAALFERLSLEAMQAGLSWITVLRKRERMRERFYDFDTERLARAGERQINSWLKDQGLIRHRGKLEALINNARRARALPQGLADLLWGVVDHQPRINEWPARQAVPSVTDEAVNLSKLLKQAGFKFVGPTMCYALMQSAGLVNDHLLGCHRHPGQQAAQQP